MGAIDEAARLIQQRLDEIAREREELQKALGSLKTTSVSANGSGSRRRSSPPKRRGGRRAARGKRQEQFLAEVGAHPGARMSEIAKAIGVRPQQLYPIARRLSSDGTVVKHGSGYALQKSGKRSKAAAAAA